MTPTQRAAALRLAEGPRTSGELWGRAVIALLRELAAEPVQEPAIWIQSNHLQHAKNGPYLARTGPTKLMSDFIPLYAAPQQRKPLTDDEALALIHATPREDVTQEGWIRRQRLLWVRAVEKAHGITGEPT